MNKIKQAEKLEFSFFFLDASSRFDKIYLFFRKKERAEAAKIDFAFGVC